MSAPASIRDPLIGTRIDGRYLVHGVLGRGGMGVVYDGEHEQLGRPVAIKVLGPGVAGDPVAVQRFLREARTASRLTHGNIVDVSDLGNLPDGRPYLVMPKVQGVDLSRLLQQHGPQTPRRTCELLRGAAAALDLIHAKGFVHRDVKPENLMHVVHDDGSEAVLLLDFGIVGLVSPDSARLTAEGVVFGTPAYIAPEGVRGEAPGPRSDIYALATVAFELITGQTPFRAANVMQLLQLKLGRDAPSMSQVAGHAIPDEIETVLRQSLARDPRARHASAGAFVAALDAALQRSGAIASAEVSPRGERLDTQARQRLQGGTGELELSLSEAPPQAVANDARPQPAAARDAGAVAGAQARPANPNPRPAPPAANARRAPAALRAPPSAAGGPDLPAAPRGAAASQAQPPTAKAPPPQPPAAAASAAKLAGAQPPAARHLAAHADAPLPAAADPRTPRQPPAPANVAPPAAADAPAPQLATGAAPPAAADAPIPRNAAAQAGAPLPAAADPRTPRQPPAPANAAQPAAADAPAPQLATGAAPPLAADAPTPRNLAAQAGAPLPAAADAPAPRQATAPVSTARSSAADATAPRDPSGIATPADDPLPEPSVAAAPSPESIGPATRTRTARAGIAAFGVTLVALASWALTRSSSSEAPAQHVVTPRPPATRVESAPPPAVPMPEPAQPVPQGSVPPQPPAATRAKPSSSPSNGARKPERPADKPRIEPPAPQLTAAALPSAATPSAAEIIKQAQTELIQGHLILAADLYERATRSDPGSVAAFRGLGLVSERLGRKRDAIRALRRAISLAPDDPKNTLLEARVQKLEAP